MDFGVDTHISIILTHTHTHTRHTYYALNALDVIELH